MYKCDKCNKEFKYNSEYKRHINRKTSCVKKIYKCENCLKEFFQLSNLNNHKNRKNKCIKIDLNEENKKLKEEIKELKESKPTIINNNINNIQINIFSPEGKLYHSYFLKSKPIEQLEFNKNDLSKLTIEDYTDELSNIYNFTNLIKELCFNIDIPNNWIMCKDELFDSLLLKKDNDNVVNCKDNLLELIYEIAKQIVEYKDLDIELFLFYKSFISKYKNNEYDDNNNLKDFINDCHNELFKHQEDLLYIIEERRNKHKNKKIEVKLNDFENEMLNFIKKNELNNELINIISKKYSKDFYKKQFKVNNYKYTGIIDLKMIDIFTYFLKLIYKNENHLENQTIKYEQDNFYIYKNNEYKEINISELINSIFSKIRILLKINKIELEENCHTEDYIEDIYKERVKMGYNIGNNKYYKNILIEYYKNNDAFIDHNKNILIS